MERRDFLTKTGLAMVAVTLLPRKGYTFLTNRRELADSCIPTTTDILGPYYRAGAPMRSNLQVAGDPGVPLIFKGTITDAGCNPLQGALVDVWHADDAGVYDMSTPEYKYRGVVETDAAGKYEFLSIIPGKYLNGSTYRPVHIHYRITAPGFTEFITQLYFTGDSDIPTDPWASAPGAVLRIVPIDNSSGTNTAVFDITLAGITGIDELQIDAMVRVTRDAGGMARLEVPGRILQDVEVFDLSGRLVARQYTIGAESCLLPLPAGRVYFARLRTDQRILVHKFTLM